MNQCPSAVSNSRTTTVPVKFCGPCPSFKPNQLNEFEPHALFCSRGQSQKPKDQIENKGCSCFGCGLFPKYELEKGYFCMPWEQK